MEKFKLIRISDIQKNPYQPRKEFSEEKIKELAQSIKENGLIQPIIVRQSPVIGYEILSWRKTVSCIHSSWTFRGTCNHQKNFLIKI